MILREPRPGEEPQLRRLWQEAFGDPDAFLNLFFAYGYSSRRCRCAWEGEQLLAALYWFEVTVAQQKQAYLYGVATAKASRGKGICRSLMADAHVHLREQGYTGAMLVPDGQRLAEMYGRMGYSWFGGLERLSRETAGERCCVRRVDAEEYRVLRRRYLPKGGVLQEASLAFQERLMDFYAGEDFVLTGWEEQGIFHCPELLGNAEAAAGIAKELGCSRMDFRIPGREPFAMFLPLTPEAERPDYFGLAFD